MLEHCGVTFDWRGASIEAVCTIAKHADESGYGYLFVPEAWGLEAFSTIGYLFGLTKKIKIGPGVANVFSRSAATIAMASVTLNQIAQGRFFLGLGTSAQALIQDWHGVRFERPLTRTKEYVQVIQKILSGEEAKYEGELIKLQRFKLYASFKPENIEIYIGAIGEKNIALSAKIASGAIVALYPIAKLEQCTKTLSQESGSKMKGEKKKLFAYLPLRIVHSTEEAKRAREELSKYISFYIASMGKYYAQSISNLGFGELVSKVKEASLQKENPVKVLEEAFDEFCLIGSSSEIFERVSKLPNEVYPVFGLDARTGKQSQSLRELGRLDS